MQFLRDLSMGDIVSRLAAAVMYAGLQGLILAGLARLMGDRRPQHDGRLTANPFVHLSVWGAAMAVLFSVSWVRSVWHDRAANRGGPWGIVLVTLLGLVAMIALLPLIGLLQMAALRLPRTASYAVLYGLQQLQIIALCSAVLNLLPVPGLVGGGLLQAIWPQEERRLRQVEPICLALVVVLIVAFGFPDLGKTVLPYLHLG